jgi:hypothetical protein
MMKTVDMGRCIRSSPLSSRSLRAVVIAYAVFTCAAYQRLCALFVFDRAQSACVPHVSGSYLRCSAVRFDQYFPPSFALSWADLVSQYCNLYTVSYFSREGHSWFFTSIGRRTLSYRESLPSCRFPLRSRDLNLRT